MTRSKAHVRFLLRMLWLAGMILVGVCLNRSARAGGAQDDLAACCRGCVAASQKEGVATSTTCSGYQVAPLGGAKVDLKCQPLFEEQATTVDACRNLLLPEPPRAVLVTGENHRAGLVPMQRKGGGAGSASGAASSSGHLIYGGGPLMQKVKVFQVIWGSPGPSRTFLSNVTDGSVARAYKAYLDGQSMDWINGEYSISLYTIGRGSFAGTITLSLLRNESKGTKVADADVQAEIAAQIDAGKLPADSDAMFIINFPAEVSVEQGETSYGRGVGMVPTDCGLGHESDTGLCYPVCNPGYHGVGPICWGGCPADYHDDGATCRKDAVVTSKSSYGRGAGSSPNQCGTGNDYDTGLCYPTCRSGFHGVGPVCWGTCRNGYTDDGATCRRDAHIISADNSKCPAYDICGLTLSKGCSKCPSGYANDGCTCRINADVYAKESYGRGAGVPPASCAAGTEYDAGLCYRACNQGYHGVGPVCWGTCGQGYSDDGATCRKDVSVISKSSYGRGAGAVPNCSSGLEADAGLCYPACDQDFHGVGPVCWGHDSFCRGHDSFCGFHSNFRHGLTDVRYAALADMGPTSACFGLCWTGIPFSDETKTFSHELVEAVTDPDSNLGWNDVSNGEIGDICVSQFNTITSGSGESFTVQLEWSNKGGQCTL
jgi:hypothetical protein